MGVAPYDRFSPGLNLVAVFFRRMFGAVGGNGFNVRPVRGGEDPSTHGFGAAWDGTILNDAVRAQAIAFLLSIVTATVKRDDTGKWIPCAPYQVRVYQLLGIQAIHDYQGCRIWRVGRTTSADPNNWWKKQTASKTTGMGQVSSRWLHLEIHPDYWHDSTPLEQRGIVGVAPSSPVVTSGHMVLHRTARKADAATQAEVRTLQTFLGLKADGWFGPQTEKAVMDYQRTRGLKVDGIVGPYTWRKIDGERRP